MTTRRIAIGALVLAAALVAAWLAASTPSDEPESATGEVAGNGDEPGRARVRTRRDRSGEPDREDTKPDTSPAPPADTAREQATTAALREYQRALGHALMPFRRERLELEALAAAGMVSQEIVWTAELEETLALVPFSFSSLFELVEGPVSANTAMLKVRRTRLFDAGRETQADLDRAERSLEGARTAAAWLMAVAHENELPDPQLEDEEERIRALEAAAAGSGSGPELPDGPSVITVRAEEARRYLEAVLPVTPDDGVAVRLHVLLARAHAEETTYEEAVTQGRTLTAEHPDLGVEARGALGLLEWYAGPFMAALRAR